MIKVHLETERFWLDHQHIHATVEAVDEPSHIVHFDSIQLDSHDARQRFIETLQARLGLQLDADDLHRQFSELYRRALDELTEVPSAKTNSQATQLVQLMSTPDIQLFHGPDQTAYVGLERAGHIETWPVRSRHLAQFLARRFFQQADTVPGAQALHDAVGVLEGRALFDGPERAVHVRLAQEGDAIYLDLGNERWEAVEITASGWRVVPHPPVVFRRSNSTAPLPVPIPGGDMRALRRFVNFANDDDFLLYEAWMVAALRPTGPYIVLAVHGSQGAAKSTTVRICKKLLDPTAAPLRSQPASEQDLLIAATGTWCLVFDNISQVPPWLSDALCRLATGGGYATRALYTDSEETIFDAMRPVALTGIEEVAVRSDLLDRTVVLYLPDIEDNQRREEKEFWASFEKARPGLLGALLDSVSVAMRNYDTVHLPTRSRMADFLAWGAAAAPALGRTPQEFVSAYQANRKAGHELALDSAVIAVPIQGLVADGQEWSGPATELLKKLDGLADEDTRRQRTWPKNGQSLAGRLRRLTPNLKAMGVRVVFERAGHTGQRTIHIGKTPASRASVVSDGSTDARSATAPSERADATHRESAPNASAPGPVSEPRSSTDTAAAEFGASADGDVRTAVIEEPSAGATAGAEPEGTRLPSIRDVLPHPAVHVIRSRDELDAALPAFLEEVRDAAIVGLDTETTGLDPHRDRLRLIQLAVPGSVLVIDCRAVDAKLVTPLLEAAPLVAMHNGVFDLQFLLAAGLTPAPESVCSIACSQTRFCVPALPLMPGLEQGSQTSSRGILGARSIKVNRPPTGAQR